MTQERAPGRGGWARPLGLLFLALIMAVGQPLVVVIVVFTMLTFLAPSGRILLLLLTAIAIATVFSGDPPGGLWYLERGWAILIGGWFVALSLLLPDRSFLGRALPALLGSVLTVCGILAVIGGWGDVDALVAEQIQGSIAATVQFMNALADGGLQEELAGTLAMTARVQGVLFPALLSLSSLASLGVAWWLHVRVSSLAGPALGPIREFRFADTLIWVFISGLALVLVAEWSVGWGRLGTNLLAFMGALYMLRGAGVLLVLWGGISFTSGLLVMLAVILAGPFVALGAMLIGVGDSWLDLRARAAREGPPSQPNE